MIGIRAIASYIPNEGIDNILQASKFDEPSEFIEKKIGARFLPQLAAGEETSDLAKRAVQNLIDSSELDLESVDALVVVTQNGDGSGLPHTSAIVQSKLGLSRNVAAFDVSLGCSGYVYGLSIVAGLMEHAGLKNGVLVTADPYSKVIDRNNRVTTLLFGDAATATWLCREGDWKLGKPLMSTDGNGAENLEVRNGVLHMNGRQVFNFASKYAPMQIKDWLSSNDADPGDIDLYVVHQGSLSIVDAISRKFPEVRERFLKDLLMTGNTISSSIPLLLEKYVMDSSHTRVLMSGFGVGLSWATNIIFRGE
jgi:3-oxoacyl-[acyl-carrier-protein] synthase-3